MRSSRLLCYAGRVAPLLHSLGFLSPSKRFATQRMILLTLVHLGTDPLLLRLSSQVLRIQKMTLHPLVHMGDGPAIPFAAAKHVQPGPSHPEDDPAYAGPSRRRSYDSLRVRLGTLLARGVVLLLLRGVGSRTIRLSMRARRLLIGDNGKISRMTRNIFVMLLWLFCWPTSCECFQPSPTLGPAFFQRFFVFEAAVLVDESPQRSSNLLVWTLKNHLRFGPNAVGI